MKITYRIPTEQYAYVEVEKEYQEDPSAETIKEHYQELADAFKVKVGLSQKDFNACLDRYLNDGTGETNTYLAMSPAQQAVIQEIKKAFKRIEAKDGKSKTV
jgi:hypothetical protein